MKANLVWVGMVSISLSGCGVGYDSRYPMTTNLGPSGPMDAFGRPQAPIREINSAELPPELATATQLLTIESDVSGRGTASTYFNVQLLMDVNQQIRMINVHRQGTTRFAMPNHGPVTPDERARICAENSADSQENCNIDLVQLSRTGVVIERLMGRAGVILKSEEGFSPSTGGKLVLHYVQEGDPNDSSRDRFADYPMSLEHKGGRWFLTSGSAPQKGAFFWMKLESEFTGMFASGVKRILVGTSLENLW